MTPQKQPAGEVLGRLSLPLYTNWASGTLSYSLVWWHLNPYLSDSHALSYSKIYFVLIDFYWKPPVCNTPAGSQTPLADVEWKEERKGEREEVLLSLFSNYVALSKSLIITSCTSVFNSGVTLRSLLGEVLWCHFPYWPWRNVDFSFTHYLFIPSLYKHVRHSPCHQSNRDLVGIVTVGLVGATERKHYSKNQNNSLCPKPWGKL